LERSTETKQKADLRDYLAAERTFLAWIRTGLALMGFGFVVARFGLFLRQLQFFRQPGSASSTGLSLWFGTALIAAGVLVIGGITFGLSRLKAALGPKLAELPAPVLELRLELVELTEHDGQQLELLPAAGGELNTRLHEGLRQVRASTGSGSVCTVVEVAPWSRIPETRALFVPRDD